MKKVFLVSFLVLLAVIMIARPYNTTIRVLVWDDAMTRAVAEKLGDFERETGIRVDMEMVPSGTVLQKIGVGVSSRRTQYDLITVDEPFVPQLGELLVPYDQWGDGKLYSKPDLSIIMERTFEAASWRDSIVGLPINGNLYLWMTRKDIVENEDYKREFRAEYGYDFGIPQTFEHLYDMAEFLSKKGVHGFAPFTKMTEGATCEAIMMFEAYGTSILANVNGQYQVVLNKARAVQAINMYKRLLEFAPLGATDYGHPERIAGFSQGRIFSMFQWPAIVPDHEDPTKSTVVGNIIYHAPPAGSHARAAVRGAWVLGIPNASNNKDAAAEFAYWWSSETAGRELVEVGMTPARIDLLTDPELAGPRPWFDGIFEAMNYAVGRPRIENYAEISDIIKGHWMGAVTGSITPETAVDRIIRDVNNALK